MRLPAVRRLPPLAVFALLAALAVAAYLAASAAGGYVGFPLDDAWIHQTYARNLGQRGEFAFVPGQPSAGSTAPLWTVLLAVGYAARLDYRAWAYALGAALLALNAWLAFRLVLAVWPSARRAAWAAGLFVVAEWHLGWAAASGMETLLASALVLAAFWAAAAGQGRRALAAGVLAGLGVLARPDGLLVLPWLLALAALAGWRPPLRLSAGFAVVFVPYLLFNLWLSGAVWPNTFYAKQAEYAAMAQAPLAQRLLGVAALPFIGAQVLLLPALAAVAWRAWRERCWLVLAGLGWAGTVALAYGLRLPVLYQHGRYLIPVIPMLLAMGVGGMAQVLQLHSRSTLVRIASRTWLAAAGLAAVAFVAVGAQAYTRDVQVIESEMVAAARWVAQNTEPSARVAAHDIGALGYFGGRLVLDLAGLVSPEVIPFIRDEAQLGAWLDAKGADYLVTFPGWYPDLVRRVESARLFVTGAPFSPALGQENMAVYRWRAAPEGGYY